MGSDEEIRAALFLQMSTINQAIALFVHSDGCCIIRFPGPVVTFSFVVSQMVSGRFLLFASLPQSLVFPMYCFSHHDFYSTDGELSFPSLSFFATILGFFPCLVSVTMI
jgi:H+-transporting ATPase